MRCFALGVIASFALSINICLAQPLRVVAYSGQQAPGTEAGVNFSSFQPPELADSGKVLFSASLNPQVRSGYWIYEDGQLAKLARVGDPLPSGIPASPNAVWTGVLDAAINGNGQVAIKGTYTGSTPFLVTGTPGALSPVVIGGDVAPGTGGKLFQNFPEQSLSIGNDGKVAFYATLRQTTPFHVISDSGLWLGKPGEVSLVARGGDPAPGAGAGINFYEMTPVQYPPFSGEPFYPPMLSGGKIGFFAKTASGASPQGEGIWAGTPGNLSQVVRAGYQGAQFSRLSINTSYFGHGMDSNGNVAFIATQTGEIPGIWLVKNSALEPVAVKGQSTGFDSTFSSFSQPDMNASGRILFWSTTNTGQALWSWYDGQLQKIASTPDHSILTQIGGTFPTADYAINDKGQIAFVSQAGINFSMWGFDPKDGLALLASTGQTIEVAPGDVRTIKSLEFPASTSASDGRPTSLNNTGEVLFVAYFTDNSSAILISGVPEPSSTFCILLFCGALCRRRRVH